MNASIVSVNVGLPKDIETPRGTVRTSIFKSPTDARVRAVPHNLDGDRQADLESHGGEHKAIYGYALEHYATWQTELDRSDFVHGQFGENLTTDGLRETDLGIGDLLAIGTAVLQVTQPRSPCYKLGIRMDDPHFIKRFMKSGRSGFYFRVAESGELGRGDSVSRIARGPSGLSVWDVWNLSYGEDHDRERLALALELGTLGEEWLRPMRSRLGR
ncbi:MAG: MOSC domain-containing protein [Myxococcota bacterium]